MSTKDLRHLFIINPEAGKIKNPVGLADTILRLMESRGADYQIVFTQYPRHATDIVRHLDEEHLWRVYLCGGDGTLNEGVYGALGKSNVEIAAYPLGTGNDFIRCFGKDSARFSDLAQLVDGLPQQMDVMSAGGGHCSLNIASVGFDACVADKALTFHKIPLIPKAVIYPLAVLCCFFQPLTRSLSVKIDGVEHTGRFMMAIACNGQSYGNGFQPAPFANPSDGFLEFILVRPMSRFTFLRFIGRYKRGAAVGRCKQITHIRGYRMEVQAYTPLPMNYDGEIQRDSQYTFTLLDTKIPFVVPRNAHIRTTPFQNV